MNHEELQVPTFTDFLHDFAGKGRQEVVCGAATLVFVLVIKD